MATATMTVRAHTGADGATALAPPSVSMEFLIVEDNGGNYHWTLLDRDGHDLARSPDFVSHQAAADAALVVLAGVGSARLDRGERADDSLDIPSQPKTRRSRKAVSEQRDATKQHLVPSSGFVRRLEGPSK